MPTQSRGHGTQQPRDGCHAHGFAWACWPFIPPPILRLCPMSYSFRWSALLLLAFSFALMSGCSGCTRPPQSQVSTAKKADALTQARELYHGANDASKFRDANEQINKHLAGHSDALAKYQVGSRDRPLLQQLVAKRTGEDVAKVDDRALYRKFLETVVGLDGGE